jgi:HAD superfamily hydrolase (TIGR01459 family)
MRDLSSAYPVWFCDIWGVLHNGVELFPATVDSLNRHRQNGGTVILVSNSPRSAAGVIKQLDELKTPRHAYDTAVTSGDVTRDLMQQTNGKLFHLGPSRDLSIFEGLGVERVSLEKASAVICTGLFHDDRETPEDYVSLLAEIRNLNLPFLCANPDKIVRKGQRLQYCAGALAEAYEKLGGTVAMAGKPYKPIYDLAWRKAATIRDQSIDTSQILAIGDGPETDILGAANQGLACVFVTGGVRDLTGDLATMHAEITREVPSAKVLRTLATLDW